MSGNSCVNTVVLSSRENYVWLSMQEIIPSIEDVWTNSRNKEHNVSVFIVEDYSVSELLPLIFKADNIVFTCFTMRLALLSKLIRKEFQINVRYIIHLHSLATIGLWPMYKYGMGEVLMEKDIFISTCKRDQKCLKLSLASPNSELIPFSLTELNPHTKSSVNNYFSDEITLCYVGRISSQKNLHTLLYAIHLFIKDNDTNFKLYIFGGEDNLGSPNMELYRPGYGDYLKELAKELKIVEHVQFMGFIERAELRRDYLNKPHILLSTSLHSDENFGISALRSLSKGYSAILSDWGGHTGYSDHFPSQVHLLPVMKSDFGPYINPLNICRSLSNIFSTYAHSTSPALPDYYHHQNISKRLEVIAKSEVSSEKALGKSQTVSEILHRQNTYLQQNQTHSKDIIERRIGCKIFEDYSDQLGNKFLESYGMENTINKISPSKTAIIPPWVTIQNKEILISDFHRGNNSLKLTSGDYELKDIHGKQYMISHATFEKITMMGYAFNYPE